jgi:ATP-dependent DNA helicase RecG
MITDEELAVLAADLESDRTERKSSLASSAKDKVGQAICALANDLPGRGLPGIIMIGVDDAGRATGLPVTDRLLQELAAFRSDGNILPLPFLTVEKRSLHGVDVAIVEVAPAIDPPVRYYGQVWIRVGPRRAIASRDEERILFERRRSGAVSFDATPVASGSFADLDLRVFEGSYLRAAIAEQTLLENERDTRHQLQALHLATPDGVPNVAATLLFGRDPRKFLPGAYVQFARFDGEDTTAPILDQKELDGCLPELLRRLDDITKLNIKIATDVVGHTQEQRRPDYPAGALQQLLRNAVLHRSYEISAPVYWYWFADRVEISSPGGLYGRVNEINFGMPYATDYRNPILAEGLKVLGFIQRFGMGVALARRLCQSNGNPLPRFEFSPSAVLCVVERG